MNGPRNQRLGTPLRTEPTEIFSDVLDGSVLRVNGRRFPGLVLQGDVLSSLHASATEAVASLEQARTADLAAALTDIEARLRNLLLHYQTVLERSECDLPYTPPVEENSFARRTYADVLYAVVRFDDETISEHAVTIKNLTLSKQDAEAEAVRLNEDSRDKKCRYDVQLARLPSKILRHTTRTSP